LTAIAIAGRLFLDGKIDRVLVCAPTSVCAVWPEELKRYAAFPFACQVLAGDSAKRRAALKALRPREPRTLLVAVINYESTWRIEDDLAEWKPDLIVCDESQRIKNPRAAQSKALHRLGDRAGTNSSCPARRLQTARWTCGASTGFSTRACSEPAIFSLRNATPLWAGRSSAASRGS
jgi:hypothetical protein